MVSLWMKMTHRGQRSLDETNLTAFGTADRKISDRLKQSGLNETSVFLLVHASPLCTCAEAGLWFLCRKLSGSKPRGAGSLLECLSCRFVRAAHGRRDLRPHPPQLPPDETKTRREAPSLLRAAARRSLSSWKQLSSTKTFRNVAARTSLLVLQVPAFRWGWVSLEADGLEGGVPRLSCTLPVRAQQHISSCRAPTTGWQVKPRP